MGPESLELATKQGQRDDQRVALANLGGLLNDQGHFEEAAVYLRRALDKALAVRNPSALNQVYSLLATNCSARGDHDGAAGYFRAALEPEAIKGLPPVSLTQCLSLLAKAHDAAGRTEAARTLRAYLLEEPATPVFIRARIEAALADSTHHGGARGAPAEAARPSLQEMAAMQHDALLARSRD